jgi:hypothetical protein
MDDWECNNFGRRSYTSVILFLKLNFGDSEKSIYLNSML